MADIPHLAWPFRIAAGAHKLSQVEQDSLEDVRSCVHSYLMTGRGERPLAPEFGSEDPTFTPGFEDPQDMAAEIMEAEDRAEVTVSVTGPDERGQMAIDVHVELAE